MVRDMIDKLVGTYPVYVRYLGLFLSNDKGSAFFELYQLFLGIFKGPSVINRRNPNTKIPEKSCPSGIFCAKFKYRKCIYIQTA